MDHSAAVISSSKAMPSTAATASSSRRASSPASRSIGPPASMKRATRTFKFSISLPNLWKVGQILYDWFQAESIWLRTMSFLSSDHAKASSARSAACCSSTKWPLSFLLW